jgi:hypothetical protein
MAADNKERAGTTGMSWSSDCIALEEFEYETGDLEAMFKRLSWEQVELESQ